MPFWTTRILAVVAALLLALSGATAGPLLLYDAGTEQVLYAEEADQPWYPASLTKLMTAYLVFEAWKSGKVAPETKITISAKANSQPKMRLGLGVGKEITFDDAVKALVIKSANDIAVAIAEAMSGSEEAFVVEMNSTAARLGMRDTRFINANGLPGEGQHTTARDLALLTQTIFREHPAHLGIFSLPMAQIGNKTIASHNGVLTRVLGADGMKTGFTCSAGYNIVASAVRDGRRLVAIVLGEQSNAKRTLRAADMLEHGFKTAAWKEMFPGPTINSLPDGFNDRESIRVANLEKRFQDCKDPEPAIVPGTDPAAAEAVMAAAQSASPLQPRLAGQGAPITTGSLPDKVPAKSTALTSTTNPTAKRVANKTASKRRNLRRTPGDPYTEPVFSLASP